MPEGMPAAPARPLSAEQPSTPDSEEALPSASTRPVQGPAEMLAGVGKLSLAADLAHATCGVRVPEQESQPSMPASSSVATKADLRNRRRAHKRAAGPTAAHAQHEEDDEDCIVCWSAAPCVVFRPCGHLCCCQACAQPIMTARALCPMCRGLVEAGISI